jgi:hypothetical protein
VAPLSAATFLGEESSPSTETLNFLLVKREAISLTRLVENCNSEICSASNCRYIASAPTTQKTTSIVVEECLPRRYVAAVAAPTV